MACPIRNADLGATYLGMGRCRFRVWAPTARTVEIHLLPPGERRERMERRERGYHEILLEDIAPGTLYRYALDGEKERPDPASRFQPQGVHGPSQVVDGAFSWTTDGWSGLPLPEYILYEIHVGTFSPEGTFDGVIRALDTLTDLGITAIAVMPVAQFPGSRNWGYDGADPFAVHEAYGGPEGFKRLVDACHRRGLALVLDVVYNHLGPEGSYLGEFGPYFADRYRTPWGSAVNFDGPYSDEVRHFFIENALYWVTEFRVDALRLDAVHAIFDHSARTFLEDLAEAVHRRAEELHRRIFIIAESNLNDPRLVRPRGRGGYGLDAQWSDDFHHALHTLLTGERDGYYRDFGTLGDLEKAFVEGFVLSGGYSAYRRRRHGAPSPDIPATRFIVCAQNHDQVGNRARGERLGHLVSFEALKMAAGAVLLSPFIPLLFMGEEYEETAPFLYFTSHSDPGLAEAVRSGRREEFAAFGWAEVPDPQDPATFLRCKLHPELRDRGEHRTLREFYTEVIGLRKTLPALATLSKDAMEVRGWDAERVLAVRRWSGPSIVLTVFNFGEAPAPLRVPVPPGRWLRLLDSAEERWRGRGSAVPQELRAGGEVTLSLSPMSLVLFACDQTG